MPASIEVILRTILTVVIVIVIARVVGKQAISQMGSYDFAFVIILGSIAGNLAFNLKIGTWYFVVSLVTFGAASFLLSLWIIKSRSVRKWISGQPTVVIERGKILEQNLKKIYYSLDTLNQELRLKDIFNIEEVEYAVLELNGELSVLKKPEFRQVVQKDLSLAPQPTANFPIELIMDGELIGQNLKENDLKAWLDQELKKRKLKIPDIFYAVKSSSGNFYWDVYRDGIKNPVDTE
ncbi:DUF421 domain-containing protein [Paenibacillus sepulcri]|uniref:DUF421 domain-containing protein n=1 Tax=Paenibacillus sepulcri TaxID=359917 RepID=A0ABS7C5D8_9BACL|nr:DUF421 domain-containing protein [Paenibacillus sepulcri]